MFSAEEKENLNKALQILESDLESAEQWVSWAKKDLEHIEKRLAKALKGEDAAPVAQ